MQSFQKYFEYDDAFPNNARNIVYTVGASFLRNCTFNVSIGETKITVKGASCTKRKEQEINVFYDYRLSFEREAAYLWVVS